MNAEIAMNIALEAIASLGRLFVPPTRASATKTSPLMLAPDKDKKHCIPKRTILVVAHPMHRKIECLHGSVWITHDGDPRDVVLEGGQSYLADRDTRMLIQALENAELRLIPTAPLFTASARQPASIFDEPRRKVSTHRGRTEERRATPAMSEMSTTLKGNDMNRNYASALAMGTVTVLAAAAAVAMACASAYADDITVEHATFVSTLSRDEVNAELNRSFAGGNPWASSYNMFQGQSATTREQVSGVYKMSRDEVNAMNAEDSGSAYFLKSTSPVARKPGTAMGGPAR
jgi:DUF2917 family protein